MRTIAVIPARFQSKRLPGKPLADIHGKTLIQRVYERATRCALVDRVIVATDDERIGSAVEAFGGEVVFTSVDHVSGSDRVAEAVATLDVELVVNVQGDEPLIDPGAIDDAVALAKRTPDAIVSLKCALEDPEQLHDDNVVKVVTDRRGFALYFSRAAIPAVRRDDVDGVRRFKHLGLYVYPKPVLTSLTQMEPTRLEQAERLEQLRALENGIPIRLCETDSDSIGVDTQEDLERVRSLVAHQVAIK